MLSPDSLPKVKSAFGIQKHIGTTAALGHLKPHEVIDFGPVANLSADENQLREDVLFGAAKPLLTNRLTEYLTDGNVRSLGQTYASTLQALLADPFDFDAIDMGLDMMACGKNVPKKLRCGSPFCPRCRFEKQKQAIAFAIDAFGSRPHSQLYFATILISFTPKITDIPDLLNKFRKKMNNAVNARAQGVRAMGFFELDLKRRDLLTGRKHTAAALKGIGYDVHDTSMPDKFWLPHWHAIVDLNGVDRAHFRDGVLRKAFDGAHQVRLQRLQSAQSVTEAVTRITGYMLKFKLQYAENIFSADPAQPNKSKYRERFDHADIRQIVNFMTKNQQFKCVKFSFGLTS